MKTKKQRFVEYYKQFVLLEDTNCYVYSDDYEDFWSSVINGKYLLSNYEVANESNCVEYINEYVKGFNQGYDSAIEYIKSKTMLNVDNDYIVRKLINDILKKRFPKTGGLNCGFYETKDSKIVRVLSKEIYFNSGIEAGRYYRMVDTIYNDIDLFTNYLDDSKVDDNAIEGYEVDYIIVARLHKFLIDDKVIDSTFNNFCIAVANADFSNIACLKKWKFSYMVYLFSSYVISNNEWYANAAKSLGLNKSQCSGATVNTEYKDKLSTVIKGM
jgi:hypothetical protein